MKSNTRHISNDPISVTRVVTRPDLSSALQVRRAELRVIKGPDKGLKKEILQHGVIVGTASECDFLLSDAAVSRRHFELLPVDDGFLLRDLGSKNGTYIGGLRVRNATLSGKEEIQIGQSKLHFSIRDEHDEYPLSSKTSFGPLLGRSVCMRQVFAVLERASESEVTLLLEGESGTGKDLAAETVHEFSPRREGPFVVVDCGTMQSTLVESELFGHRKGAFTGADMDRPGVFESANSGTVFLDEIGELDPPLQLKLLRLLERREVKRLGDNRYRSVDVRLIAATNRDLSSEVDARRFRQDLFYRLSVVRVRLPPLRDRREDIGLLARGFVQKLRTDLDPVAVISDQVLAMFMNHDWPGNVRELRNVVERLLLFPDRPESAISQKDYDAPGGSPDVMRLPFHEARQQWNDRFEKAYLSAMLDSCENVVARAAERAGIPRQTFHRLMAKHRLIKWSHEDGSDSDATS